MLNHCRKENVAENRSGYDSGHVSAETWVTTVDVIPWLSRLAQSRFWYNSSSPLIKFRL